MNLSNLDFLVIGVYFLLLGWFAFLTRRTKTFSDFSIAGHSIPASMIFASVAASLVGPGFSVGMTSRGYTSGFAFVIMALPFALQTLASGLYFAPRLSKFRDCHTLGDVMERCYGRYAHLLAGLVSVGLCIGFSAIMAKIGGTILQSITGIDLMLAIIIVTMFAGLYSATGGIKASIATDGLQFVIFVTIIPAMLVVAFLTLPVSTEVVMQKASELTSATFSSLSPMAIFAIMISFFFGEMLLPPYANRALAAKSSAASRKGFLITAGFTIVWLGIVAMLGVYGHAFLGGGATADDVFVMLGSNLLPAGFFGLLLAALIAIVMSSQDSVLNAGAVALTQDIVRFFKPGSNEFALKWGRYSTIGIAAVAAIVARYSPSIIDGLLICYSIWAPALLLPLLIGLHKKTTVHAAGITSMIAGGTVSILWQTVLNEPFGISAILAGLLASLLGYLIGSTLGTSESVHDVEVA